MGKITLPSIVDEMADWIIDGESVSVRLQARIKEAIRMTVEQCAEQGEEVARGNSHVYGGWGKLGDEVARRCRELLSEREEWV